MPTLYLLIGGNQDDRLQTITQAADLIRQRIGSVVACSHIYETAPWGTFADGEKPLDFYNQALEVSTTLSPHEALKRLWTLSTNWDGDEKKSEIRCRTRIIPNAQCSILSFIPADPLTLT